ncbi:MAG TPA: fumarylacetoacetate hydrolase family protein [Myxococcales bacterium]|nr:fumarylacetoacetate hydrolase family protein [Myxococcales bacterium]
MAPTRRTFLKSAGAAAVASRLFGSSGEARAQTGGGGGGAPSPRGQTWCNLKSGLGMKQGDRILDVAAAAKKLKVAVPATTDELIAGKNLAGLHKVLTAKGPSVAEKDAQFEPCITRPEKIIMLGFNYRKHIAEVKVPTPTKPVLFNKYNNALAGHRGTIHLPTKAAQKFDYEVELQVIMGKAARDVSEAEALDHVFGYATGNDFSARDLQLRDGRQGSQFMIGKTPDGFFPVGPYLVGADVVGDPQKLAIECSVNGEKRQSSNTADMLFSVAQIIAYASTIFTLKPGDIISTGTPEGVILGMPPEKQVWLKAGDKVSCSVEKLGELHFDLA